MGYCTTLDVRLLINISSADIDDATVSSLIDVADRKCNARIAEAGIDLPISSPYPDTLKDASCNYACAEIINRKRIDLSRPANLNLGDISFGTSPDTEIQLHLADGKRFLELFISDTLTEAGKPNGTICEIVEGI